MGKNSEEFIKHYDRYHEGYDAIQLELSQIEHDRRQYEAEEEYRREKELLDINQKLIEMSRRKNGKNKEKLAKLAEISKIDKKIKKKGDLDKKLQSRRDLLRTQLKTT